MPMSIGFEERLYSKLPQIVAHFGTPFHIYDERGIEQTVTSILNSFLMLGYRNYLAVKAIPNLQILRLLKNLQMRFDCSSIPELIMARQVGAAPEEIMFTSNNTTLHEYEAALADGGCILNLDDITFVDRVPDPFPELICFRYNPGERRSGSDFIGNPVEAKYGLRYDQLVSAYALAMERGAQRFGLHTMIISNELSYRYMVETVKMLLEIVEELQDALGINFEFVNIGGGIGIPYRPEDEPFDFNSFSIEASDLVRSFRARHNGQPRRLFTECGRYVTGPHGALVTTMINRMSKHREYYGVDASMSALMRPAMYGAYHHITIVKSDGGVRTGDEIVVDVVGSLCENIDKFAVQRLLPAAEIGDFMVIHDTGAHGYAMGFNYNARLRPKELLLRVDGSVELIRRAETIDDYLRTTRDFEPDVFKPVAS